MLLIWVLSKGLGIQWCVMLYKTSCDMWHGDIIDSNMGELHQAKIYFSMWHEDIYKCEGCILKLRDVLYFYQQRQWNRLF